VALEYPGGNLAQMRLVLDQQHRVACTVRLDRAAGGGRDRGGRVTTGFRNVDAHGCPDPGFRVKLDVAARILDDPVDGGEAETRGACGRMSR
jgi:hypothetical protein